jgi:hypothetical protein
MSAVRLWHAPKKTKENALVVDTESKAVAEENRESVSITVHSPKADVAQVSASKEAKTPKATKVTETMEATTSTTTTESTEADAKEVKPEVAPEELLPKGEFDLEWDEKATLLVNTKKILSGYLPTTVPVLSYISSFFKHQENIDAVNFLLNCSLKIID